MRAHSTDAKSSFLQGSVGDQELHCGPCAELSQALGFEHHHCIQLRKISVRAGGCTTRVVEKGRETHDKSSMENLDNRTVFMGHNNV